MNLLFTRHGETDWNVQKRIQGSTDTDLNENGRMQAVRLARQLETNRNGSRQAATNPSLKSFSATQTWTAFSSNTTATVPGISALSGS